MSLSGVFEVEGGLMLTHWLTLPYLCSARLFDSQVPRQAKQACVIVFSTRLGSVRADLRLAAHRRQ